MGALYFDQVPILKKNSEKLPIAHDNIRGAIYYLNEERNKP
jgi:hypothetical protein